MNFNDPFAHGAYLVWDGGLLKFDTVDEEDVERDADIVEHPVETGANIVDHYRVKNNAAKLTAFISQEPVDPSIYPEADGSVQNVTIALPTYPAPSVATNIVGGILSAGVPGLIAQALAKSPPTTLVQSVLAYNAPIDTLAKVLGILEDLRSNATVVAVATRSWYYADMMLGPISTKRNKETGSGTAIEIELKGVRFVSTDTVAAPPTPKKPKDKPKTDKGKQNGKPLQSEAVKLIDFFSGGGA